LKFTPTKLAERVKYLKQAYDALSAAYVLFFNYRTAAETYETISKIILLRPPVLD
jgi:hypothetical protein